jgi:hypothetical protein
MPKQVRIPASSRAGLALLFVGAMLVALGSYLKIPAAIPLYGLVMAIGGFSLYIISSIVIAKRRKNNNYR